MVSDDPKVYSKGGLLHQFTHNNMPSQGIRGLFSLKQIEEIIQLTKKFAA